MRSNRIFILLVIAAIILFGLMKASGGGIVDAMAYSCRQTAESMRVNWIWSFEKGCFIQQPSGAWIPIDQTTGYHP